MYNYIYYLQLYIYIIYRRIEVFTVRLRLISYPTIKMQKKKKKQKQHFLQQSPCHFEEQRTTCTFPELASPQLACRPNLQTHESTMIHCDAIGTYGIPSHTDLCIPHRTVEQPH